MNSIRTFAVAAPARLDLFLVEVLAEEPGMTRSQLKHLIEAGRVTVDGKAILKAGELLRAGASVTIDVASLSQAEIKPFNFTVPVLFEDEYLIVIDKPAGLTVHPGAGNKDETLVNALVGRVGGGNEPFRPGVVHRLDKDTSGVLLLAKRTDILNQLSTQFSDRTVDRRYSALVLTTPRGKRAVGQADEGIIDAPIGRDPKSRVKMAVKEGGRAAVTTWKVVDRFSHGVLLDLKLLTGRTHQIRVHMESIGAPVIGDRTYGDFSALPAPLKRAADEFGRQALHARSLDFDHPLTGTRMRFASEMPEPMKTLIELFKAQ